MALAVIAAANFNCRGIYRNSERRILNLCATAHVLDAGKDITAADLSVEVDLEGQCSIFIFAVSDGPIIIALGLSILMTVRIVSQILSTRK